MVLNSGNAFSFCFRCLLLAWLLKARFVFGIPWDEPQQTSTPIMTNEAHDQIPRPTAMAFASHDLLIRQQSALFPTVCGYIGGEFCKPPSHPAIKTNANFPKQIL
jgi:hypothetical protein